MPRIAAIQASGANPFFRSFGENFATRHRVTAETIASAIRIGDPVSYDKAVASIRATNGVVAEVSDEELMAAKRDIDRMGIGCEPASATTLAGVRKPHRLRAHGARTERHRRRDEERQRGAGRGDRCDDRGGGAGALVQSRFTTETQRTQRIFL